MHLITVYREALPGHSLVIRIVALCWIGGRGGGICHKKTDLSELFNFLS